MTKTTRRLPGTPFKYLTSLVALGLLFSLGVSSAAAAKARPATAQETISAKQLAFHDAMRKLWEDHITWTRLFLVSAAANLPDKGATTDRLLQNQVDIGNAIKPFYGAAAGDKLTVLLKTHITIAAEIVSAAKANDTAKVQDASKRWLANADDIASFLSGANPKNWTDADMKQMMHDHLNFTTEEVTAHLKGDWASDITAYDKVHEEILRMADMLSAGIINQFPNQFK